MKITKETKTGELFDYVMDSSITATETLERFTEYVDMLNTIPVEDRNGMNGFDLARNNFGYFAGYYDDSMRKRCQDLLGAVHPIFGHTDIKRTSEEIFKMGQEFGKNGFRKKKVIKLNFPTLKD